MLGHDLRRRRHASSRREIGYVPQAFSLPSRSLGDREPALHRAPASICRRRVRRAAPTALLERTGLAPFADRAAGALSGGMKQKLAIANALLAAAGAARARRADRRRRRRRARRDLGHARSAETARALVLISTSYLDEVGGLRSARLPRRRPRASRPARRRSYAPRATLELYRVWGDDPRAIARAARALPYVRASRASAALRPHRGERRAERPAERRRAARSRGAADGGALRRAHAGRHGIDAARARAPCGARMSAADHPARRAHQALRRLHRRRRPASVGRAAARSSRFSAPTARARARRSAC